MIEVTLGILLKNYGSNIDYSYGPYVFDPSQSEFPDEITSTMTFKRLAKEGGTINAVGTAQTLFDHLLLGTEPQKQSGRTVGIAKSLGTLIPEICEYWINGGKIVKKQPKIDLPDSVEFYNGGEILPWEIEVSEDILETLQKQAVTPAFLKEWDGCYYDLDSGEQAQSNFVACSLGPFGTSVTKNVGSVTTLAALKALDNSDSNLVTLGNLKLILPSNFSTLPDAYTKSKTTEDIAGKTPRNLADWEHDNAYVTPNALAHWSGAVAMPEGTKVSNLRYCNIGTGTSARAFTEGAITEVLHIDDVNASGTHKGLLVNSDWGKLLTSGAIAHWNGQYYNGTNDPASSLAYCNKGAFGTAATHGVGSAATLKTLVESVENSNANLVTQGNLKQILNPLRGKGLELGDHITNSTKNIIDLLADSDKILEATAMAYWDGRFRNNTTISSNLMYCNYGSGSVGRFLSGAVTDLTRLHKHLKIEKMSTGTHYIKLANILDRGDSDRHAIVLLISAAQYAARTLSGIITVAPHKSNGSITWLSKSILYWADQWTTNETTFSRDAEIGIKSGSDTSGGVATKDLWLTVNVKSSDLWHYIDIQILSDPTEAVTLQLTENDSAVTGVTNFRRTATEYRAGTGITISDENVISANVLPFPNNTEEYWSRVVGSYRNSSNPVLLNLFLGQIGGSGDNIVRIGMSNCHYIDVPQVSLNNASADTHILLSGKVKCNNKITAASFYESSDARLKDAQSSNLTLDQITSIPLVNFTWKDKRDLKHHLGTIAQDVQEVAPEIVDKDADGMLSVEYDKLGVLAIDAVRQLKEIVDKQADMIKLLQDQIQTLKEKK